MIVNKKNCTATVEGKIKKIIDKGMDSSTIIVVEYQVDDENYSVAETLKLKSEVIKLGFLPIGQRKYPAIGSIKIGTIALVNYNPDNPAESFITENEGWITS